MKIFNIKFQYYFRFFRFTSVLQASRKVNEHIGNKLQLEYIFRNKKKLVIFQKLISELLVL